MRQNPFAFLSALAAAGLFLAGCGTGDRLGVPLSPETGPVPALKIGDRPVIETHLDQAAIEAGGVSVDDLFQRGRELFVASFNTLDGACRPESTGTGAHRDRREFPQNTNRISAPDANSCAGCHNLPIAGGGGDNVGNVFVLGQRFPFVNFDNGAGDGGEFHTLETVANERNTLGMFGSGYVELLAREMTARLQSTRAAALAAADVAGVPVPLPLSAKGVFFGVIIANPDGTLDDSLVEGVDTDLVIKPFHQKGAVTSLREFTNNAMNHHHGMQSEERFGHDMDPDADGVVNELTVGDMTAATVFQALLAVPGRVMPPDPTGLAAVAHGESLFTSLGCAECHIPALRLDSPLFTEPNPYNPPGNLRVSDVDGPLAIDLTTAGPLPRLPREADGTVLVPLFSDLKRHDMGPLLNNETLVQAGIPTEQWLTKKLWGFASEPPFLHNGRATMISEAILMHGGEGQAARDAFASLIGADQNDVIEFLQTLRVLPEGTPDLVVTAPDVHPVGERPGAPPHLDQALVNAGAVSVTQLFEQGKALFQADFKAMDGQGRPETTGTGTPRARREFPENFNRISGPDSNSCFGCHNLPFSGGGGDNVANVFVLGQRLPFVNFEDPPMEGDGFELHTLEEVANERNTLGMNGSGWIELLAREMTDELQEARDQAIADAALAAADVTVPLVAKGISFGSLTAHADGTLDTGAVEGVDADLVIKPFHQKGAVPSLRVFTNNALNHHHGIQSSERFGAGMDPDNDGHADEASPGDVTALTLYQALLPVPGRVLPSDPTRLAAAQRGEALFTQAGCAVCHVPSLTVTSAFFTEPGPYNGAGNLRPEDVPAPFAVDLTVEGPLPRLPKQEDGSVVVPAFTDLKRHDMGPLLDNEKLVQAGIPTNQWLTRKLWGFFSEPPFLHSGRAYLVSEAILAHGGEGQAARDAFEALSQDDQDAIVEFLRTLQILPEGTPTLTIMR